MLASVRRSLLRSPTRPTFTFSLSTTSTTTTTSTTPTPPPLPVGALVDIVDEVSSVDDTTAPPRSTKSWKIFYQGNIIRPTDLSPEKCRSSRNTPRSTRTTPSAPVARYNDVFRQLDLDPVDFTLNPYVLSAYISEMGKIYGRNITGLTSRSQRRLGKAIRRARMIGIIPQLSRPSKSSNFRNRGRSS